MDNEQSPVQKDNQQPEKESWVRAHKLTAAGIAIACLSLIVSTLGATAGWLKFPAIARRLGLERLLADSPPPQVSNQNANAQSTELDTDDSGLHNQIVSLTYESPTHYERSIMTKVSWRGKGETLFEIFDKNRPLQPFQTFSMTTERPDIDEQIIPEEFSGSFIIFDDLNFDGYVDMLVRIDHSACCAGYACLIYQPYLGTFNPDKNFDDIFSFISGYKSDPKKKEIHVYHHIAPGDFEMVYREDDKELPAKFVPVLCYDIDSDGKKTEAPCSEE